MSPTDFSPSPAEDDARPWVDHLEELRIRFLRIAIISILITLLAFTESDLLLKWMMYPLGSLRPHTFALEEAFLVRLKVSVWGTVLFLLPYYLLELWGFVRPGLYPHERRWVGGGLLAAVGLAYVGIFFSWGALLPLGVRALQNFVGDTFVLTLRAESYLRFLVWTTLASMALFEMPLVFAILSRIGLLDPEAIARNRRGWILTLVTALAVITPSVDMLSLIFVSVPLWILFEISIMVARTFKPSQTDELDSSSEGSS